MTSEDEWERSLMDDDAVGRAEATEAELMPKVLSAWFGENFGDNINNHAQHGKIDKKITTSRTL